MRRFVFFASTTFVLAACQSSDTPISAPEITADRSVTPNVPDKARIPGSYIVVLRDDARDVSGLARRLAAAHGGRVGFVYERALKGFSITVGAEAAAQAIARNPNVAYVEPDQVVTASATQSSATWGLDRVDQRSLPLSGNFSYTVTAGNVWVYILDTGIRVAHVEFGRRASLGFNAYATSAKNGDCNGHGTHVAGTVGGATYGIAKAVNLVAVRVLSCQGSGSTSGLLAGIDYVVQQRMAHPDRPVVANMSLGYSFFVQSVDEAITAATGKGITVVVAAGNSGADACGMSPASTPDAITVGATTSSDARSSFSNYGSCVDIFAPGTDITSAAHTNNIKLSTLSGTSMASPHVAGVAALYLAGNPTASPTDVASALTGSATTNVITNAGTGSPNRLLFTAY